MLRHVVGTSRSRLLDSTVLPRAKVNSLPALTGARFIAAFAVVVWHFGMGSIAALARWLAVPLDAAPVAVSFFYVLSGAVLTCGVARMPAVCRAGQRGRFGCSARRACCRRICWRSRLRACCSRLTCGDSIPVRPRAQRLVECSVLAALLLVQAFVAPLGAGLNTPGWSVSCEAFFYLLWPGLVGALRSSRVGLPLRRALWLWLAALVLPLASIAIMRLGLLP